MKKIRNKHAEIEWDTIVKITMGFLVLLFLTIVVFLFKDKIIDLLGGLKQIFRFGR